MTFFPDPPDFTNRQIPLPSEGDYTTFSQFWTAKTELLELSDYEIVALHSELPQLLQLLLLTYRNLLSAPSSASHIQNITTIAINSHHLINKLRPVQVSASVLLI